MNVRVEMWPPARGAATRHILGTTLFATSPSFINGPAIRRMDSIRFLSASFAFSSSRVS
jgi:hypothetical protein